MTNRIVIEDIEELTEVELTPEVLAREVFTQSLDYHGVCTITDAHRIWDSLDDDTKSDMVSRAEHIIALLLGKTDTKSPNSI